MPGANARISRIGAITCSSHWLCQSSSVSSSSGRAKDVPALLTRMSTGAPASSATRSGASGCVTSIPELRDASATIAPSASRRATTAAPMPLPPPVTTATRPEIPRSIAPHDARYVLAMRARAVGVNHVALEVADVDEALAWYGAIFEFELRGRVGRSMAFVDLGDQFLAFSAPRDQPPDGDRHFGLVVDDRDAVREGLAAAGAEILAGRGLSFRDPWGNLVEVVQYDEVQFLKTDAVLGAMGLGGLGKTDAARRELREKGIDT